MANQTTEFKRTVSGTINSGMRSVFGGEGRRYFIIEHKDDSALHRRGEQQKMIVDEVFIGRDKKCQVLIDEQFGTVSREHAVIVRDGDRWKLIHRSSTNDTFVNGQRVMGEQYLQNGDEIQLSYNGPRLGFIIPQGDQSFVKSIGMTARLNLFRQQALRPYKTALTIRKRKRPKMSWSKSKMTLLKPKNWPMNRLQILRTGSQELAAVAVAAGKSSTLTVLVSLLWASRAS